MNPSAIRVDSTKAIPSSRGTPYSRANVTAPRTSAAASSAVRTFPNSAAKGRGATVQKKGGNVLLWVVGGVAVYFLFFKKV